MLKHIFTISVIVLVVTTALPRAGVGTNGLSRSVDRAVLHAAAPQVRAPELVGPKSAAPHRTMLDKYCVTCHNGRTRTAGLTLDTMDLAGVAGDAAVWEKVLRKVRGNEMPPMGRPRPDEATSGAFVGWLTAELDVAAKANPDPGRSVIHRLNRIEYGNAIRDLFGIEVDVRALLPADDEEHGFDNVAEVLSVSATLLERYLSAAQRISQLVVGDSQVQPVAAIYPIDGGLDQDDRTTDDLPFGSRGVSVRHYFPFDGEYVIKVRLRRQLYGYIRGMGQPHRLDVRVDGARVGNFTVGRTWDKGQVPPMGYAGNFIASEAWEAYAQKGDEGLEVRVPVKAGARRVGISFQTPSALPEGVLPPPVDRAAYSYALDEQQDANPAVATVEVTGPYNPQLRETPSRQKLFVCNPARGNKVAEDRCAEKIFSHVVRLAYRRPSTPSDIRTLVGFYSEARASAGFDSGIQAALERVLVDPEFLFRMERDPQGATPGAIHPVDDLDLASRLSFFLWSSIPDDELLTLAAARKLSDAKVLDQQVRRMLADDRAKALATNFASQWLRLRSLRNASPDIGTYTSFDENLRAAMERETELFIEDELANDRSVVNLLTADYTFVNERLARHYDIPNVYGPQFRRVKYPNENRAGILGHGSILTVTSYANRTSPVLRGKWLLENLLAAPPPPPPPNIPSLPAAREAGTPRSVRERLEVHRKNPVCATCHNVIDPLGFALENYDAIGRWRTTNDGGTPLDSGVPIDASSTLADGSKLDGPAGLRRMLLTRKAQFVEALTEKLMTYALGRMVAHSDMPTVRQIAGQSVANDYKWSSLISGIVKSTPFRMRRATS